MTRLVKIYAPGITEDLRQGPQGFREVFGPQNLSTHLKNLLHEKAKIDGFISKAIQVDQRTRHLRFNGSSSNLKRFAQQG